MKPQFIKSPMALTQTSVLALVLVCLTSCNPKPHEITDQKGNSVQLKQVVPSIKAATDTAISYALYLPPAYNGSDKLPVVFFFDPHGDGALPLRNYQSLAEKRGYIFIGSNDIRNGQTANTNLHVFQVLFNEIKSRFLIDEKSLFTAGFSGGAKMAMLFAQQIPEISGVIACGGSIPLTSEQAPSFYFSGIVGATDFNYLEMQQTFSMFDQAGFDYTSVIFKGAHHWPPREAFNRALTGIEFYRMKTQRAAKDDSMIEAVWKEVQDSLEHFSKSGEVVAQMQEIRQAERWFNGLKPTTSLKKQQITIEQSPEFYDQIRKIQNYIQKEVMLRAEFVKAIDQRELDWWSQEIARIEKNKTAADEQMAMVTQRLLNYISMASFMLIKTDLDDVNLDDAFKKIQIYEKVDPRNPDVYLMYARYYLLLGNRDFMVSNFKKAIDSGFNSWGTYENENSWKPLFEQPEILKFNQH